METRLTLTAATLAGQVYTTTQTHRSPYGAWALCAQAFDRHLGRGRWHVVCEGHKVETVEALAIERQPSTLSLWMDAHRVDLERADAARRLHLERW